VARRKRRLTIPEVTLLAHHQRRPIINLEPLSQTTSVRLTLLLRMLGEAELVLEFGAEGVPAELARFGGLAF